MRSVLAAVALLCATLPAHAADVCVTPQAKFLSDAQESGIKIWAASPKAVAVIVAKVNEVRASRGAEAYNADEVYFGVFEHNGQLLAAIMFFKDKCAIPGSGLIIPAGDWAQAIVQLGLTTYDFSVLSES
jgi:hypothetical protein